MNCHIGFVSSTMTSPRPI